MKSIPTATNKLPKALSSKDVYAECSTSLFRFKDTRTLKATDDIIAQSRAMRAIEFGLGIRKPGYNIYVSGQPGTGKTSVIKAFLESYAKKEKPPKDWVYVHNFEKEDTPMAIDLAPGEGFLLKKEMDRAIETIRQELTVAFQSEAYENGVSGYMSQIHDRQAKKYTELEKLAKKQDFEIKFTQVGVETIPIINGKSITEKDYNKLGAKQRKSIEKKRADLEPLVLSFVRKIREIEYESRDYVKHLQKKIGAEVLDIVLNRIYELFQLNPQVTSYLIQARNHILENLTDFVDFEEQAGEEQSESHPHFVISKPKDNREKFNKYKVNLLTDNRNQKSAPVIIESNPTYYNLFGKVEKNVEQGIFLTDFTMIQAGALHKANGGYLVLEASDILKTPHVWDTFKRVLRNRKAFIEDIGEQFSMLPTAALRPEPIPLDLKIILIGSDEVYHLLYELDDEFSKVFKIKADFDYKMPRNKENIHSYVAFVATRCVREKLLPFDPSAVATIVEYGSRLVENQEQISTQFSEIKDLSIEADFIARQTRQSVVKRSHVEKAIEEKIYRVNLVEESLHDMMRTEDILMSVGGRRPGQINGLAVYEMGDFSFGKPVRITCTTSVGDDGVFNIDHASKLSGVIHDKSVHILTGFLNALLAKEYPLSLAASVCFEQSYGMIDGDSATAAELTTILSSLGEIPIHQNLAVTGSLNQFGEVQPVGGINEKIEGFYRCCKLLNHSKEYMVIIPHQNVNNLMLSREVREAIKKGFLKIYPVKHFWQIFELATGVELGIKSITDSKFKKGSVLEKIKQKLDSLEEKTEKKA